MKLQQYIQGCEWVSIRGHHRLASNDTNKQRKRKWVKYERRHSMSLWHTDWYLIEDDRWSGKWLIAYLDDASRFIVGYGIFDEATTENAIYLYG